MGDQVTEQYGAQKSSTASQPSVIGRDFFPAGVFCEKAIRSQLGFRSLPGKERHKVKTVQSKNDQNDEKWLSWLGFELQLRK